MPTDFPPKPSGSMPAGPELKRRFIPEHVILGTLMNLLNNYDKCII